MAQQAFLPADRSQGASAGRTAAEAGHADAHRERRGDGQLFATRVGLTLPETPSADRAKQAIFLVDTSLSAGPQFPLWTKLLRATLENNRDSIREFAVLFFNVETFWWQEKFVANTPENVDALMNYADGLALEGATDLGRALKEAASPAVVEEGRTGPAPDLFLLSDGAATWGEDRWPLLAAALTPGPSPKGSRWVEHGWRRLTTRPLRLSHRPGRRRSAVAGLSGRADRRGGLLAGGRGGDRLGLGGPSQSALAADRHRNGRRTRLLVAGRPQYVFPGQQLLVVGRLEADWE